MDLPRKMRPIRLPQVTFPKIKPEKMVAEYKISQQFDKIEKLFPELDVVRNNDPVPSLAMLQMKLRNTEKLLRQKRRLQVKARQDLDNQWQDLADKESSLRENFLHFNLFVRENTEKRERAERKITEDNNLLEFRQKETKECLENYIEIKRAKYDMDMKIKEYYLYEDFLSKVVEESSGEFNSIADMINRYLSLVNARNHLSHLQEDNLRDLENAKSDMMKLIEEKNFIIMGLNNQIANLQARYENANIKSLEYETLVTQIKNNAGRLMNEMDEVKSSIWNIYGHMVQSKDVPVKAKKENVEEQVMYIKRTLTEIAKVNAILRKRAKAPAKTKGKNA